MNNETESSFHTCRACLLLTNNAYPIFEDIPQSDIKIITMLNSCSIEIGEGDDFPKMLCVSCFKELRTGYNFIQTFRRTQDLLIQQYLNECNEEIVIFEENNDLSSNLGQNLDIKEDVLFNLKFEDPADSIDNDETMESFVLSYEKNKGGGVLQDSDDQDFLIEQSVQLTQHYKLHKLDGEGYEFDESESEDNTTEAPKEESKEQVDSEPEKVPEKPKPPNYSLLSCPLCPRTFKRFHVFGVHLTQHNREITCKLCSVHFKDTNLYLEHYQTKHRYQCKICQKSFPRGDTYTRHMQIHNNTLPQFICPVENCSKTFTVRQSLRNHFRSVHSEKRNFLCNLCGASFKNYDNLRYHTKKHKGPSHLCTYCGKAFMQAVHLTYHMWRHTGIKPHKCVNCEKSFVSKKVLQSHLKKHCAKLKKAKREEFVIKVEGV